MYTTIIELPATWVVTRTDGEIREQSVFPKSRYTREDAQRLAFTKRASD